MRVPLSWLAEYVDLEPGSTPEDVHAALVRVGLEEEDIHVFGVSGPVVVGEVLEFVDEPQSNGKTIRWCQVRVAKPGAAAADGGAEVRGIVCGAHNFETGDKVVVTLPGSVLPGPFPISARKTYGHVSDGMIASARELGLGEEHDGILRLKTLDLDPEVGDDAVELLGLDDAAVEVNVTPDRGYALSIRGIAREYSHATGAAFRDPALSPSLLTESGEPQIADGFVVRIDDRAPIRGRVGATVFVTRVVRHVDPSRPTPAWMRARLSLAGMRSISLVVDITNYVMLELGQPIHGYDLDLLQGGITVRRAAEAETLVTLDGQTRRLDVEDLVIADDSGVVGLAGVMGGRSTEITASTTNVLVEAANFDPVSVARTARRHKLPSEAARRFERGVDPGVAPAAAARVVRLLEQLAGGAADDLGSQLSADTARDAILVPAGYVSGLIGVEFDDDDITRALAEIGGLVAPGDGGLLVVPPSWRPDLSDKADLAEEVARIIGYDRIPSILPIAPPGRGLTRSQLSRRAVAVELAANGLTEVLAYPFVSEKTNDLFGSPTPRSIAAMRLANPMDATVPFMRTSLLGGLVEIARRNLSRGVTDLALYEIGLVFRPHHAQAYGSPTVPLGAILPSQSVLAALNASIPPQPRHVAAIFVGNSISKKPQLPAVQVGLADALAAVAQIGAAVGAAIEPVQAAHQALHPGRTAELVVRTGEKTISVGYAGELLPAFTEQSDLPRVVGVFELDLDALIAAVDPAIVAAPISVYPAATQDLSLIVGRDIPAETVRKAVVVGAGDLLEEARLVDDYRGPGVNESDKSLTFALRFRASDRTLTAQEATASKLAGAALAASQLGAVVRE